MASRDLPAPNPHAELEELERRLAALELRLDELARERESTQKRLAGVRAQLNHCPKCGRRRDFLTDEGGFLAHVLEDSQDTELLTPDKPLFCPDCGEVFLYRAPSVPPAGAPRAAGARRRR